jgi:hypothetical protein
MDLVSQQGGFVFEKRTFAPKDQETRELEEALFNELINRYLNPKDSTYSVFRAARLNVLIVHRLKGPIYRYRLTTFNKADNQYGILPEKKFFARNNLPYLVKAANYKRQNGISGSADAEYLSHLITLAHKGIILNEHRMNSPMHRLAVPITERPTVAVSPQAELIALTEKPTRVVDPCEALEQTMDDMDPTKVIK